MAVTKRNIAQRVASGKIQSPVVAALGTTTNLTAVPGSFADLAAVQTFFATHRAEVEARLDAIEAKVDAILTALKSGGIMASS